jgi:hypothetical protein
MVLALFLGCNENVTKVLEMSNINLTKSNMHQVITGLEVFRAEKGYYPSNLQQLQPDYVHSAAVLKDGWGNELVYTIKENDWDFQLVSKGKDRLINTADDIIFADGKFTLPLQ